jgi:hypothetical protein
MSWPPLLSPDGLATTVPAGVPSLVLMSVLGEVGRGEVVVAALVVVDADGQPVTDLAHAAHPGTDS